MSATASTGGGSVTITLDGSNKTTSMKLMEGTVGPAVFDIRKLYDQLGVFTYDPGYGRTASCESQIPYTACALRAPLYPRPPEQALSGLQVNGFA